MKKILILIALFSLLHTSRAYSDISISTLGPTQGITITTQASSGALGTSVKTAGDFNGDGYDDVLIGSPGVNSLAGAVYVIFGGPNGLSDLEVTSGLTASQGVIISGANQLDYLGYSVSYAGDVNDDGIDDIIIGAYLNNGAKGAAYVIYGSKTPPAIINLTFGLSINQGFSVTGNSNSDSVGISVSYAGDVNNDKIDDVIIGASGVSSSRGTAYVIFGKKGTRNGIDLSTGLDPSDGFSILGVSSQDSFGKSVSSAGDIDGDGIGDLIIGAPGANAKNGVAYFIYGKSSIGTIDLTQGWGSPARGFSLGGTLTSEFGYSVSSAGDFNGDGKADVVIGAYAENASQGAAYVFFGNARSSLINIDLDSVSTIDTSRWIRIGETTPLATNLGVSVSGASDINKDGIDDIIVGAQLANANTGAAFVIFGNKTLSSEIIPSDGLAPNRGFRIFGESSGDYFGASVSYAGDLNGDGVPDVIVGAKELSSSQGAAYLLFSDLVCFGETELVNGICVTPSKPETSLGTAAEVAKGLFDSGSTASRIFTMGRSLSVGLGLIAKIIQNVRFLDIAYPEETVEVFKTYGTDLFELPVPEAFYESPETKELSSQYARYDTEPSFLENYWNTIMTMLISLGSFLVIKLIQFLTKTQRKEHIMQVALKNIGQTFANFFIVQIYSNLDDVIFYLLLDIQSTKLSSPSAGISLGAAILFLVIGLALVFFHCWLLSKYQQAKSQGALERFEEKYRILGTLYDDFKDDNIAKQSFFGILILRCVILILVIMLLRPQWMQGTLLMLTNLIFLAYFIYYRPFKSRFDEIVQYFCELTVFVAYLCVLILSIFDAQGTEKSTQRNGLGKCIVIAGIVLALGGFIIQVIQTLGVIIDIWKYIRNYYYKKEVQVEKLDSNHDIKIANESSASILNHTSPISMGDHLDMINSSHNNRRRRRVKLENLEKNDLEVFPQNKNNSILQQKNGPKFQQNNNQYPGKTGHWVNMPNKEEDSPQKITADQSNLQVFMRPLGSRIHQQKREKDTLNSSSYMGLKPINKAPLKRKKIKRNAILPDISVFDNDDV